MNASAFEALETKLAFLERASVELSDEIYRQRKELDELRARLAALANRVDAAAGAGAESSTTEERPPHY